MLIPNINVICLTTLHFSGLSSVILWHFMFLKCNLNKMQFRVHTCSSVLLVCLVRTKRKHNTFGPGPLSVHTGIFDSEPKNTEPKGIVIR